MATDVPPQELANNPVLQFRLRTLLWVTTWIAILAAIAGFYFRRQTSEAQSRLFLFWGCLSACSAVGVWWSCRDVWKRPKLVGNIRFMTWTARRRFSPLASLAGHAFSVMTWLWIVGHLTFLISRKDDTSLFFIVFVALTNGMMTGGMIVAATRRPAFIGDDGVKSGQVVAPWKCIRHAEWLADRPGVLKFRWLDGDIYVDVPARMRDEVEVFVRAKTTLVEAASTLCDAAEPA
jgi:hypothetical protein